MYAAVPIAVLLLVLFAGLTFLRLRANTPAPNAKIMSDMLNSLEDQAPRQSHSRPKTSKTQ